ncbi:polysaccharide lyase [Haliangium ochraceum]|uniref:Polysaccharide lyase 14 domain-containing protein n=1 Tax=Haliangium ochraceum (strain DSM 14365 / JCM 11303 / SMP-2) TaxID=502025 RepID=D0LX17_HALO1|nr:hypothetical protein [Haliangium ochraceum]ACY14264.1 hypothetical protein Hoch_1714 [Haliangium ochraceum DSM 14365]
MTHHHTPHVLRGDRARRLIALMALLAGLVLAPRLGLAQYTDGALWRQNFETMTLGSHWFHDDLLVQPYTTGGADGRILRAAYQPNHQGSPRLGRRFSLSSASNTATLSFDMKLHSAFEFVRGGKMHGLAGGTGTTGCKPIDPNGWSVRMMWRPGGVPVLYIYHQDRDSSCGDDFYPASNFAFERGRWYRVEIFVRMNSSVGSADGEARLYIDGVELVDVRNLNLSGNSSVAIDQFMFSTFYGGNDPSWSPSQKTYVYYDNFTVYPGERIGGADATTCEVYESGIYDAPSAVCCADSCGSCGGSGCSGLPGGSSSCCTGSISNGGDGCFQDGVSAPCWFE